VQTPISPIVHASSGDLHAPTGPLGTPALITREPFVRVPLQHKKGKMGYRRTSLFRAKRTTATLRPWCAEVATRALCAVYPAEAIERPKLVWRIQARFHGRRAKAAVLFLLVVYRRQRGRNHAGPCLRLSGRGGTVIRPVLITVRSRRVPTWIVSGNLTSGATRWLHPSKGTSHVEGYRDHVHVTRRLRR